MHQGPRHAPTEHVRITGYRLMWVFVLFDLPVDTPAARRAYAQFRKWLLRDGFTQLQYSVYARCCPSQESAEVHATRVANRVPDDGEVRILYLTDKQFARQEIYDGKRRRQPDKPPRQLEFF